MKNEQKIEVINPEEKNNDHLVTPLAIITAVVTSILVYANGGGYAILGAWVIVGLIFTGQQMTSILARDTKILVDKKVESFKKKNGLAPAKDMEVQPNTFVNSFAPLAASVVDAEVVTDAAKKDLAEDEAMAVPCSIERDWDKYDVPTFKRNGMNFDVNALAFVSDKVEEAVASVEDAMIPLMLELEDESHLAYCEQV